MAHVLGVRGNVNEPKGAINLKKKRHNCKLPAKIFNFKH